MLKIKGYTLIELLITMAIFALLFSFSFAAYTNFNKNRSLENGAREVEAVLRDAQHRAISGEYDQTGGTCKKLNNWKVTWTDAAQNYSLVGECVTTVLPAPPAYFIFKTVNYQLSNVGTVQFANTGFGTGNITFNPFLQAPVSMGNICITMHGAGFFYKVAVSAAGAIDVSKKTTCP